MTNSILNPFVPCAALIFLDDKGVTNTYCMRERGHEGEHNTENRVPEVKDGKAA